MTWTIEFFETARGSSPPRDFVLALPPKAQAKLTRALDLLEEFGPAIGEPYVKPLRGTGGLMELRTTLGSDAFRLFFFHAGLQHVVIVHGIRKKTQQTPPRDVATAEGRMKQHLERRQ